MYKYLKLIVILLFYFLSFSSEKVIAVEKIKIGLLVPMTGDDKEIGIQIIKSIRIALKDINSKKLEIYPKDTNSNPTKTINAANELKKMGVNIVIGPVFYNSLSYLDEVEGMTFVSLTNKTLNLPKNVISSGINATSQINAIKKFTEMNKLNKDK